jgi:hypothetical protein
MTDTLFHSTLCATMQPPEEQHRLRSAIETHQSTEFPPKGRTLPPVPTAGLRWFGERKTAVACLVLLGVVWVLGAAVWMFPASESFSSLAECGDLCGFKCDGLGAEQVALLQSAKLMVLSALERGHLFEPGHFFGLRSLVSRGLEQAEELACVQQRFDPFEFVDHALLHVARNRIGTEAPFLGVDQWYRMADVVLTDDSSPVCDRSRLGGGGCVVFTRTRTMLEDYGRWMRALERTANGMDIIVLTADKFDECVPEGRSSSFQSGQSQLKRIDVPWIRAWFTMNPCSYHPKLHPLPIGPKWGFLPSEIGEEVLSLTQAVHAKNPIVTAENYRTCKKPQDGTPCSDDTLWAVMTIRSSDVARMSALKGTRREAMEAAVRVVGADKIFNESVPFEGMADSVRRHRFVLSPSGAGLDTHRTWETLMAARVPIVLGDTPLDEAFAKLPVLRVKSWASFTKGDMEAMVSRLQAGGDWDMRRIYWGWWYARIRCGAKDRVLVSTPLCQYWAATSQDLDL